MSNENFNSNNNDNNNNNIIITAGIDGSIRVWDLSIKKNLYQFLGYKVWIGSVWTDGVRIVTDLLLLQSILLFYYPCSVFTKGETTFALQIPSFY